MCNFITVFITGNNGHIQPSNLGAALQVKIGESHWFWDLDQVNGLRHGRDSQNYG